MILQARSKTWIDAAAAVSLGVVFMLMNRSPRIEWQEDLPRGESLPIWRDNRRYPRHRGAMHTAPERGTDIG